jgi:hypothetical protein
LAFANREAHLVTESHINATPYAASHHRIKVRVKNCLTDAAGALQRIKIEEFPAVKSA